MAYCENCGTKNIPPSDIREVGAEKMLIGPCCYAEQTGGQQVEYGIELTNTYGLRMYLKAGGLTMQYRRSPDQIRNLISRKPVPGPAPFTVFVPSKNQMMQ